MQLTMQHEKALRDWVRRAQRAEGKRAHMSFSPFYLSIHPDCAHVHKAGAGVVHTIKSGDAGEIYAELCAYAEAGNIHN